MRKNKKIETPKYELISEYLIQEVIQMIVDDMKKNKIRLPKKFAFYGRLWVFLLWLNGIHTCRCVTDENE